MDCVTHLVDCEFEPSKLFVVFKTQIKSNSRFIQSIFAFVL